MGIAENKITLCYLKVNPPFVKVQHQVLWECLALTNFSYKNSPALTLGLPRGVCFQVARSSCF